MGKERKNDFMPQEIYGDTPATRRWFAISICEVAKYKLKIRGVHEPSCEEIEAFVKRIKEKHPGEWAVLRDKASQLRRNEFLKIKRELFGEAAFSKDVLIGVGEKVEEIYQEIDKDLSRNCAFLDKIIFPEQEEEE
ncbi:hypothetical protein MUP46_01565 [Patescibacteria group bacterium]|nr:hypothetical protein [Patescibacteria group bacterium]